MIRIDYDDNSRNGGMLGCRVTIVVENHLLKTHWSYSRREAQSWVAKYLAKLVAQHATARAA